jgi:Rod binding domain-containing protein
MATATGFGSLNTQGSLMQSREAGMMQALKSSSASSDDAKIKKSSTEFEAILVGNWLQQAEHSFASVPGADDDEDSGQRDQVMSFGVEAVASSLAASGGIGIGKMVAKALKAQSEGSNGQAASPAEPVSTTVTHEKSAFLR